MVVAVAERTRAERGSDVLQVVADDRAPIDLNERIERVAGLHVDEVRPPAEDLQRAQLAAMLDNR